MASKSNNELELLLLKFHVFIFLIETISWYYINDTGDKLYHISQKILYYKIQIQ